LDNSFELNFPGLVNGVKEQGKTNTVFSGKENVQPVEDQVGHML
jgi:hypothetical protein